MRIVIQRVTSASVEVEGRSVGEIDRGLLVLVGVGHGDSDAEAKWLAEKTVHLRVFSDDVGKMNRSVMDVGGAVLAVSQFTLLGDCQKGRRPAFTDAAPPELANRVYESYMQFVREFGIRVQQGVFAADMQVRLVNDGPVTMIIDRVGQSRAV